MSDLGAYLYVSNRLTRQVIEAAKTGSSYKVTKATVEPEIPFGGKATVQVERGPDPDTLESQAEKATKMIKGDTGSVADLGRPYLRLRLDAHLLLLPVAGGWGEGYEPSVAGVAASQTVAEIGRVAVALFGSSSNYLVRDGARRQPSGDVPRLNAGWFPSAMEGVYSLFEAIREPGDPVPQDWLVKEEANWPPERIAEEACGLVSGGEPTPLRRVEILAQRWIPPVRDLTLRGTGEHFDLAIVGAPLWIRQVLADDQATPARPAIDRLGEFGLPFDRARRKVLDARERAYVLQWAAGDRKERSDQSTSGPGEKNRRQDGTLARLQQPIAETLRDWDEAVQEIDAVLRDPATLKELCRWFVVQSAHRGEPFRRLSVHRRPPWWKSLVRSKTDWRGETEATDVSGVVVSFPSPVGQFNSEVLVTSSGAVYDVAVNSRYEDGLASVVHWPREASGPQWLRPKEDPRPRTEHLEVVARAIFSAALSWRQSAISHRNRTDLLDPWFIRDLRNLL